MSKSGSPDITDTRVQHIAAVSGESPEQVIEQAEAFAEQDGQTVDAELTEGDEIATLVEDVLADASALDPAAVVDDSTATEDYGDATL